MCGLRSLGGRAIQARSAPSLPANIAARHGRACYNASVGPPGREPLNDHKRSSRLRPSLLVAWPSVSRGRAGSQQTARMSESTRQPRCPRAAGPSSLLWKVPELFRKPWPVTRDNSDRTTAGDWIAPCGQPNPRPALRPAQASPPRRVPTPSAQRCADSLAGRLHLVSCVAESTTTTKEKAKIRDRGTEPPPTGRRLPHHF